MFSKLLASSFLALGLMVTRGVVSKVEPKDCCSSERACCQDGSACCEATVRLGCCEKGLKCCADNKDCCDAVQKCCTEGLACCEEAKACCGQTKETVKMVNRATPQPGSHDTAKSCCKSPVQQKS